MTATGSSLRGLLARRDLTMEELVETAERLVRKLAPKQTKYKVTERPDARTIRYYVTQGLLPKPLSYEGGRARYGGSHLLRLVYIKRLQAEQHTLAHIARVLGAVSDEDIVPLLADEEPSAPAADATHDFVLAQPPVLPSVREWEGILKDREARLKLADSLESLAAYLRKDSGDEGEDA